MLKLVKVIYAFFSETAYSTGMDKILTTVSRENQAGVAMFALAFGKDADWKLVQKISDENHGFARKIYIDSDASLQIAGFYDEVAVTLMKDVQIKYLDDAVEEGSLTKSDYGNYYEGKSLSFLPFVDRWTLPYSFIQLSQAGSLFILRGHWL